MSLLTYGDKHRGTPTNITAYDEKNFRTRSHSFVKVDEVILPYLKQTGFGHVINITSYGVDRKFILALCERWRPETHTFHLPTGECTVTLEDVHMLLGLRVNGLAVVGQTNVDYSITESLLGVALEDGDRRGQCILTSWLRRQYAALNLDANSSVEQILWKTRLYILILFANLLFPDTNGNTIHIQFLPLLEDINKIGRYSWGAATLAHLYKNLCRCAKKNVHNFAGCGVLLQAWGWSRMSRLQPRNLNPFQFPYATKWSAYGMNYEKTPHHCAPGYRTFFDHFEPADFTWRPYLGLEDLDPTESGMWSTTTFIICFTTVEMHHSDRVKLQFGIQQDIPGPPKCMEEYHKSKVIDQWRFENWKDHYKQERRQWTNRRNTILQGDIIPLECKPSRDYMEWYKSVSNLYLSQNRLLFDPRNQPTPSNFQHTTQQHTFNTQQPFNPTQSHYTPTQHYNQQYQSFNSTPYNTQQQQQNFTPSTSYTQPQTPFTTHYNQQPFTQPTPQQPNTIPTNLIIPITIIYPEPNPGPTRLRPNNT